MLHYHCHHHSDPTRNIIWIPLFEGGGVVPPALDLVHADVYCFSDEDKQRLLSNLSRCPGGLQGVQDTMSRSV